MTEDKRRCTSLSTVHSFHCVNWRNMFVNSSLMFDEVLTKDNPLFWSQYTPANCDSIRAIGIVLSIAAFVGIALNGILLCSFVRYENLRTPPNVFIIFIVALGLLASISILPMTASSSIYCYWLFGKLGCQFEAFMALLYACSSSYLLCAISLTRCYIIMRPFKAKNVTVNILRI